MRNSITDYVIDFIKINFDIILKYELGPNSILSNLFIKNEIFTYLYIYIYIILTIFIYEWRLLNTLLMTLYILSQS